jgi:hypothetical protein
MTQSTADEAVSSIRRSEDAAQVAKHSDLFHVTVIATNDCDLP